MIVIQRPGLNPLEIDSILIDFEGTLASDRRVHPKAKDKINLLSKRAKIYILTKEGKGPVEEALKKLKADIIHVVEGKSAEQKIELLHRVKAEKSVAIGNGVDDVPLIERAGLGICVMGKEGVFSELIMKSDLVFLNILDALDFLLRPTRQKATLSL